MLLLIYSSNGQSQRALVRHRNEGFGEIELAFCGWGLGGLIKALIMLK
jgi:hypothetical protein